MASHLTLHPVPLLLLLALAPAALVLAFYALRLLGYLHGGGAGRLRPPVATTMFGCVSQFHRIFDYFTDLHRRHRTFLVPGPSYCNVYTVDPANVEYILRTNFANYGKGWYNYDCLQDLLGDGIFAVDGEKWRHQRKLASFEFTTKNLRDFGGAIFKKNAAKLSQVISEAAESESVFDMQDLFMKSTMDSICEIAFGVDLNTLGGDNKQGMSFARAFDESSMLISHRFINDFWKIVRFLNFGTEGLLKEKIKTVDEYVYKLILAKANKMSSQGNENGKEDILSRFMMQSDKDPENMNDKYLRDIMLNFVIAGKDTTAGTLSWFCYLLCKYPLIQEKVALEVENVIKLGDTASFENFTTHITDEVLEKLHYLHAALTETLRLYPAVPADSKVCFSDDTLPDGFSVRKGDIVTYQPYPMGRMEYIWGEDAEVFRPERWLDGNGVFCPESPFKLTAFQAGPRICLGKEFAYRQMKIFCAVLLRFFTFRLSDEKKAVNYRTMLTLQIDGGLHLRARRR